MKKKKKTWVVDLTCEINQTMHAQLIHIGIYNNVPMSTMAVYISKLLSYLYIFLISCNPHKTMILLVVLCEL